MQAPQASQRSIQRRSPVPDEHSSINFPVAGAIDPRASSASARSTTNRRPNPSPQLSQIEKSVTHLLVATKQLLETLTQWSRKSASEAEVSDVYVRLGYEFNIACRTFTTIGVETADLGPVPDLLRSILEETLSQEASPESLDRYLPRIRDIIINLLHGLKRKQQRLRQRNAREQAGSRQGSVGSTGSGEIAHGLDDGTTQSRTSSRRYGSGSGSLPEENVFPPRTSSSSGGGRTSPVRSESFNTTNGEARPSSSSRPHPPAHQSRPSNVMQNVPPLPPTSSSEQTARAMRESVDISSFTPPPPPPKQQDAFATLQRSGELERRASRRYSQYQISKHLGASPGGVPMLPPTQHSPVPNRGRDVRESINAVRTRASFRQRSANRLQGDVSPNRSSVVPRKISEETPQASQPADDSHSPERNEASPSPERKPVPPTSSKDEDAPVMRATLQRPPTDIGAIQAIAQAEADLTGSLHKEESSEEISQPQAEPTVPSTPPQSQQFLPDQSPQPGKELTLFLQYKSKVKKFVLPGGSNDLSVARLQLAFIEKFAWNTHSNGNDLPEIYIQDPLSGVRHELEDLSDVKDRSVLVLNVEALDEVKRHIDDGLGGLRRMMEGVRTVVDEQAIALQRVSDRQQAAAKEMASLAAAPPAASNRLSKIAPAPVNGVQEKPSIDRSAQVEEIQSLRRDLAVVRQTFSGFVADIEGSMTAVRTKASNVKANATAATIPPMSAESGRSYVNAGKKTLGDDSERIVNRVDDLQDLVEDLRKDVVSRGVRPLPRQLDAVSKDISLATKELRKMQEFLKREKPIWTKIWEKELELVCNDRDLLTMQEELAADLEDDLEKLTETFGLVEEATKQQNVQGGRLTPRNLSNVALDQDVDPVKAKDGVLDEVRALQPNHETRLEAIERAEKARQKELESRRGGEFQRELGSFVEEGRLKKSGGVAEAERLRKAKDERIRREVWEKQNKRAMPEDAPAASTEPSAEAGAEQTTAGDDSSALEAKGPTELPPPYDENGEGLTSPEPEFADAKEEPLVTDSDENGDARDNGHAKAASAADDEADKEHAKNEQSASPLVKDDEPVPEHERALI